MIDVDIDERIRAVRRFNRFYTRQIGVLQDRMLESPFSLAALRVIYELAHRTDPTAAELGKELGLDAGYLSRILRDLERRGLVERTPSETDGRRSIVRLSDDGRLAFSGFDARSHTEAGTLLDGLSAAEQRRLVDAMRTIESLLGKGVEQTDARAPYLLRTHQPGDMGWVVHRHGVLYAQEYGWDERFEGLVARIVADFIEKFDPRRERCWIAEREGEIVGSVFLVKHPETPDTVAKLRLLLVEPSARGLGIGRRLVDECTRFARQAGYRKITLWTNSVLHAARRIYEAAGYQLVHEEPHDSFGHHLIGQTWDLELR
jgi:DNA-binding MarR family transcriptional regulator/GNAT superfamily N-acetyltransferase